MPFGRKPASVLVRRIIADSVVAALATMALAPAVIAQQAPPPRAPRSPRPGPAPAPSPVERLAPNQLRVGTIRVDLGRKELSVDGIVNEVPLLEFLANTEGGWKAYESALELSTNAINFNVACLLIGLDNSAAVVSRFQFDPQSPQGDPVELFVEWEDAGARRRVRAEQLIYNRITKQTLSEGPWVYTGSVFREGNFYVAETEGTLVGFMHTTAPIIESPRPINGRYGDSIINPELNLKPGMAVQLIVRALPKTAAAPAK